VIRADAAGLIFVLIFIVVSPWESFFSEASSLDWQLEGQLYCHTPVAVNSRKPVILLRDGLV
jgi:hypothetical protein